MAPSKKPFVRATEVWIPSDDNEQLVLAQGDYGDLVGFATASVNTRFGYGEGLPGLAWERGHPIVMQSLTRPLFLREDAAAEAGLTCGVAIPILAGADLKAVMVLLCGDDEGHVGAIEVWHAPADSNELGLADGYFGTADKFEFQSKHIKFRQGIGLPGMTWEADVPVVMKDLGRTKRFLRRESAQSAGITRGLGIPLREGTDEVWILTFLSAISTPIADRFEVWVPRRDGTGLIYQSGICESGEDLADTYAGVVIAEDTTVLGQVLRDGVPRLSSKTAAEADAVAASCERAELKRIVAMPVFRHRELKAVIAWYTR
jgi:hypothetical protein